MTSSPPTTPVNSDTNADWRNWWQSNTDDVATVLECTTSFMNDDSQRECLDIARSARLYERLVVFIFVHLSFYGAPLNFPDELRNAQATWNSWKEYQLFTHHHIIRDTIIQCSPASSSDTLKPLAGIDPQHMIELDMNDIQTKVLSSLSNQDDKKAFFNNCLSDPIPMLNLLQELLDRNQPSCENNILLARAIARLSKRSGCYPDCLILSNVRRTREHPVAGGGFADVWQGISDGRPVALKALRIYAKPSREIALKEFCHEATIWRQLVHPNILPFYGVFKGDDAFDRLCLVSPWMDAGNVSTYLAMHTSADRISLLADVANGLDYLHLFVTPIVHGDLKGANIFVTNNLTACLGDFGLSHFKDSVDSTLGSTTGHTTGTLRWQAPELFQRGDDGHARRPSRETDSYSFGCVCLELITDRPPFSEIRTDFAVLAAIMNGETPRRPSVDLAHRGLDDSLWAVIEKCWHRDPNLRPTSKHLVQYFNLRRGLIGPDQVFMMPDGVEREINPASSLREGTVSEKVLQPLAATSPTASTTTYANGLFPNYQPRAHRQSARLLIRTLATTAAEAQAAAAAANNTSTTIAGPAPKKRKKDAPSDYAPPLKRSLTGNKHDNAIGAKTSRQRGGAATIENVHDDNDGRYIITPHDMIFRRYRSIRLLRQCPFDDTVEAVDTVNHTLVAIKIIRAVPKYRVMCKKEILVLQKLKEHDQDNKNKCTHLLSWFEHLNHICLVTELLGMSTCEFLRVNHFQPFPRKHIQDFARHLFGSIAFLHDLHLIHTDLKPECILLVRDAFRTVDLAVSKKRHPPPHQKRILDDTDIRLTDFGSATFESEHHSTIISTRHYRAPEIILGLGWSYPCDVFSLGCILVEFYIGAALFQTHDSLEHLAMMEMVIGHMPEIFARSAACNKPEYFREDGQLDWPKLDTGRQSKKDVQGMKSLKELIPPKDAVNQQFLDLLKQLLGYDPAQRISVRDALQHPYFMLDIPMEDL